MKLGKTSKTNLFSKHCSLNYIVDLLTKIYFMSQIKQLLYNQDNLVMNHNHDSENYF